MGCLLYEERIPKDPLFIKTCDEFNIEPTTASINGGEDYELLFTVDIKDLIR